ncbi:MAG: hypothetical protein JKY00_00390 [Roseicyclus sp.]|nr:hypothetical protein [Roseicyclus sp.]
MHWIVIAPAILFAAPATALTCTLNFTIEITQGVGTIRPGTHLPGFAEFTTDGRSFRQEGGSTSHLATGTMTIGDGTGGGIGTGGGEIGGPIWTLITTSRSNAADLVGVYAHHIEGLSYGGLDYEGPMALTLYGAPGSRPEAVPPTTQAEWDGLDLRRAFMLHAPGADMLAGDVLGLTVECS